ncbi:cytochrome C [Methylogaea oryzae]|nr:cytochrome C [Methylogaea oryzae]
MGLLWVGLAGLMMAGETQALPSFARQTGSACSACHVQSFGPGLTPYGRQFKLNGYTWSNGESNLPPVSALIEGSFTNTKRDNPAIVSSQQPDKNSSLHNRGYNANNNFALDQASLFYGGKVYGKAGAFVQMTYDGVQDRLALDNTDIRVADQATLWGQDLVYGVSFNNNPSVQDLWNTTTAWGYPYASSRLANTPGAAPIIGSFGGQLGGASLYTMINDLVFLEAGAYGSFSKNAQKSMGNYDPRTVDGGAPYWRVALQKDWNGHYFSVGQFGFRANVFPDPLNHTNTDRYTDLGVDATYQYLANMDHIFELKGSYIRESQNLAATQSAGGAAKSNQQLNAAALNASYTYQQTYGVTFGYNRIGGTKDTVLYENNISNKPASEYFTAEASYVPFGKHNSTAAPWLNLRFAVQYVAYNKFNGGDRNVDPSGVATRASDNNTLYLNTSLSF